MFIFDDIFRFGMCLQKALHDFCDPVIMKEVASSLINTDTIIFPYLIVRPAEL